MHPLYGALNSCAVCAGEGYTCRCDCTSVHLCAPSLQNLAVPQNFYYLVSISVERSWWPHIRWCGTGWFQEQGKCIFIGLDARFRFVFCCFPFLIFHSLGRYCGAGVFGLIGCYSLPALHHKPFLIITIIILYFIHITISMFNIAKVSSRSKVYWLRRSRCKLSARKLLFMMMSLSEQWHVRYWRKSLI